MREGWAVQSLDEVADQCLGKMLDKSKNRGTPKPYLRNLNVRWFGFDLDDMLEMRFEDSERERYTAIKGDVLICEGGYPGRAAIWSHDEPVYLQKALHRVRFHEPERAKWFLYFLYLSDIDGSLRQHFTGAGIQHFTGETLKRFRIPFPPLPEQKRLVAILDEAFEGIDAAVANAEKNLANARELFESYLNSVFTHKGEGWVEKPLGGIAAINYGYTAKASFAGDGPKFLRITDIQDDSVDWSTVPTCPINNDEWKRHKLFDGDIVFARTGATTGKSYLLSSPPKSVAASYLIRCRLNDKEMLASFVALYFQTNAYWEHISKGTTGSAQGGFNASKLADLVIPKPPFSEQKRLVARFDALAAETKGLQAIYQQKLESLAELKQAILQKAFAGELTAQPEQFLQEAVA